MQGELSRNRLGRGTPATTSATRASSLATSILVSGVNEHGALCVAHPDEIEVPTRVLALRSQFVRCIGAGSGWSACGTSAGLLVAWGAGELPLPIGHIPNGCTAITCDAHTVHFLTDDGQLFSWRFATDPLASPPQRVLLPTDIDQIACGTEHVLALSDGGSVFSWGRGAEGQLGRVLHSGVISDATPRRIDGLPPSGVSNIACGGSHSALVTPSGELLACGPRALLGGGGGGGDNAVRGTFAEVPGPWQGEGEGADSGLGSVACGRAHTLALGRDGKLYAFGEGASGQLGTSGGGRATRAMRAGGALASATVERVWASPISDTSFARARLAGGASDVWHAGDSGDSGSEGTHAGKSSCYMWGVVPGADGAVWRLPEELPELRGLDVFAMVASPTHCLALLTGGDMYSWGGGASGGAGGAAASRAAAAKTTAAAAAATAASSGATGLQLLGVQPSLIHQPALDRHRIVAIACGDGPHALALTDVRSGGRVVVWGRNERGELGVGMGELATCAPRLVTNGALAGRREPLRHVAAGGRFSLVSGSRPDDVFGWGEAGRKQLGVRAVAAGGGGEGGGGESGGGEGGGGESGGGEGGGGEGGGGEGGDELAWTPRRLAPIGPLESTIGQLMAGALHAAAVLVSGAPAAPSKAAGAGVLWGCGDFGALGRGDVADHPDAAPCNRGSLSGQLVRHLACGRETSAAIDAAGCVHLWGRLWEGSSSQSLTEPRSYAMADLERAGRRAPLVARSLCCSGRRFLLVCAPPEGTGGGDAPEPVVLSSQFGAPPTMLRGFEGHVVVSVEASADVALATTADGRCVRVSLCGTLPGADGAYTDEVALPASVRAVRVAAARTHCALLVEGAVMRAQSLGGTSRPPSAQASGRLVAERGGPPPAAAAAAAMMTLDPELEAKFQESLTLGDTMTSSRPGTASSRPGTAGSRPGTAVSQRPCWLD